MKAADLFRFAGGALRGHRLRTALTVLGVAIGIAAVVLLTSLGEGARRYVTGEFASLGSNLIIVLPGKTETAGAAPLVSTATRDLTLADVTWIERRLPAVRRVSPVSVGTARAAHAERGREITVFGCTHAMLELRKLKLRTGRYLPENTNEAPVCVLGAKVARELFDHRNPVGAAIRLGDMRLRVIGVIAPRGMSLGVDLDEVVHVPVGTAMTLFDQSSLFRVVVEVRSHDEIATTRDAVLRLLAERHGAEDVTAITQDSVLSTFDRILGAMTVALGAIAAISLAVAGIGIMNVMLVAVSERTREIGLLKALGATHQQVLALFLVEAAAISAVGGAVGLLVGIAGVRAVRALVPALPAQPPAWAILAAVFVSVGVGLLFGSLPARRAMRLDPIEALLRTR